MDGIESESELFACDGRAMMQSLFAEQKKRNRLNGQRAKALRRKKEKCGLDCILLHSQLQR